MLPVNCGSHADYQNFVVTNLRKYYPNPDALARDTWDIVDRFGNTHLSIAGDGTPVVTSARERKHHVCDCLEKGITDCDCNRFFSQPDCDIGWDTSTISFDIFNISCRYRQK